MKIFNLKYDENKETYINSEVISSFINKVFAWLFIGLGMTTLTLLTIFYNLNALRFVLVNNLPLLSILATFGITFFLSYNLENISLSLARTLFIIYSILTGIMLTFLIQFDANVLFFTLIATTSIFAISAVYGYLTNDNLARFRSMFTIGLILLIIVSFVNLFLNFETVELAIGYFGAVIFTGLVAYKVNSLKAMAIALVDHVGQERVDKYAVFGAFSLYLSFINLFLSILRILSNRRKR